MSTIQIRPSTNIETKNLVFMLNVRGVGQVSNLDWYDAYKFFENIRDIANSLDNQPMRELMRRAQKSVCNIKNLHALQVLLTHK
jgi:hypothetical protein